MTPSNLVRWGAGGFVVGGGLWLAAGLTAAFTNPLISPWIVYYYAALVIVAPLLVGLGMVGLHSLQEGNYGRIGGAGFYTVLVGLAAQIMATVASLSGSPALGRLSTLIGLLVLMIGFALYGVASLRAKIMPRWHSVLLIAFVPLSVALGTAALSNILMGVVLIVLGVVLWPRGEGPAEQAPRVR